MVAAWDIYAQQLLPLGYGHPLWGPELCPRFGEVHLGDVGYLREGHFCFLFNTMRDADDPINSSRRVPQDFEKFDPPEPTFSINRPNEITQAHLHSKSLQSMSISTDVSVSGSVVASASAGLRYQCHEDSGALLILKGPAHKTYLDCKMMIRTYMRQHLASWCGFANTYLGIGLDEKDIIFVSGFTKTSVWAEAAFSNSSSSGELIISGGCFVPSASGEFRVSMTRCNDASVFSRAGPYERISAWKEGADSSERIGQYDQCIFLNYYKMKSRGMLRRPSIMRAAAGPHRLPDDSDSDDAGSPSSSQSTVTCSDTDTDIYDDYDPVNVLLDYILTHSDAELACASDSDLMSLFKDQTFPQDIESALEQLAPLVYLAEDGYGSIALSHDGNKDTVMRYPHSQHRSAQTAASNVLSSTALKQETLGHDVNGPRTSDAISRDLLKTEQSSSPSNHTTSSYLALPSSSELLLSRLRGPPSNLQQGSSRGATVDWESNTFILPTDRLQEASTHVTSGKHLLNDGDGDGRSDKGGFKPEWPQPATSSTNQALADTASFSSILSGRKCSRMAKDPNEVIWSSHLDEALLEGLDLYNLGVATHRKEAVAQHNLKTGEMAHHAKQAGSRTEKIKEKGIFNYEPDLDTVLGAYPSERTIWAGSRGPSSSSQSAKAFPSPCIPCLSPSLDFQDDDEDVDEKFLITPPKLLDDPDPVIYTGGEIPSINVYEDVDIPPFSSGNGEDDFDFKLPDYFGMLDPSTLTTLGPFSPLHGRVTEHSPTTKAQQATSDHLMETREYSSSLATSAPEVLAVYSRPRSIHAGKAPVFHEENREEPPTMEQNNNPATIEVRRRQNTLAARRSRKRKLEYQMELEASVEHEREEKKKLKQRVRTLEELLKAHGHDIPPSGDQAT